MIVHVKYFKSLHCRNSLQRPPNQQFQSTRLIKNMEVVGNRGCNYVKPDQGVMVRNRHYSGHSTSPDRNDHSPERGYNRHPIAPPRSYIQQRSPSSSPIRPPRSRSSPTHESAIVLRANSRKGELDRSPSVINGFRERSNDGVSQQGYASPANPNLAGQNGHNEAIARDRLSKFIEYRGEDIIMPHAQDLNQETRRPVSTNHERGQSLPPAAMIENIRKVNKSPQYKSMYQLPPSPTRPAPVLERGSGTQMASLTSLSRVSISQGSVTEESRNPTGSSQQVTPEKIPRHPRRLVSALRPPSNKRQAPSPPVVPSTNKGLVVRRVVSSNGHTSSTLGVYGQMPPNHSNLQKAPSMRRIAVDNQRSSVENGLDSSFSESEGLFNGETDQVSQDTKTSEFLISFFMNRYLFVQCSQHCISL